jgi:dihydrolipoamide dehydrogenase
LKISAEYVVLANGSMPVELPFMPFGGDVLSSTEALSLPAPPKRLAVIGAGYIGLELGSAFRKFGSEVVVIEARDSILPNFRWLSRAGVEVLTGAVVTARTADGVSIRHGDSNRVIAADAILVTVGRRPLTEGWGLENMAVDRDGAFVKIDDQCRTSMRDVFAIGDLVGEPMLAHKASAQGEMVAAIIGGHKRRFDPAAIPAVCFTEPEIVSVGLDPAQAKANGVDAVSAQFPFAASGRAMSMNAGEGFVRVVARRDNHRILGVQAVGAHVSELSGEFTLAIEMGAVIEDIAGVIHAHPTLSESFGEAALRVVGMAIHV